LLGIGLAFAAVTAARLSAQGNHAVNKSHLALYVGTPLALSVAYGQFFGRAYENRFVEQDGLRLVAEPGLRGGKLRAGYVVGGGMGLGYALEAGAMREWRGRDSSKLLFGSEIHGSLTPLDIGFGAYGASGARTRLALSLGIIYR